MSYSQERSDNNIFDERQKKLSRDMAICQKVADTLATPGWKDIIEPILDKMIMDTLGGKVNGTWYSGKVDRARSDEKREFYIGAKQALIDLHNHIYNHVRQMPIIEEQLKELVKDNERGYRVPMEDTRYNPEGK